MKIDKQIKQLSRLKVLVILIAILGLLTIIYSLFAMIWTQNFEFNLRLFVTGLLTTGIMFIVYGQVLS